MSAVARAAAPVVEARTVTRVHERRGQAVKALDHVDFSAFSGEVAGVVGRSGSGKSTLLMLIGLLDQPTAGRIVLEGREVTGVPARRLAKLRRGRIGFLFQDGGLIERMSVFDCVAMPLRYARAPRGEVAERVRSALEAVQLGALAGRLTSELSGGERQRAGLARALALQPRLLICDEPTAALDAATSRLVADRLRTAARRGAAVVVATHDPIMMEACDRKIALANGQGAPAPEPV